MIRLQVPASTTNLGCGFDCLGVALDLRLELQARPADAHTTKHQGELAGRDFSGGDLLWIGFDAAARRAGVEAPSLTVTVDSAIPVARGLGSSGSALIAGILLYELAAGVTFTPGERTELAAQVEGHPDNAGASAFGGCLLVIPCEQGWRWLPRPLHPDLSFAVAWPDHESPTSSMRACLPDRVGHAAAVAQGPRLAALLEGLATLDAELIAAGMIDCLHEPHRAPLSPGYTQAQGAALDAGALGATLSGSGSTVVALCAGADSATSAAEAMAQAFRDEGFTATSATPDVAGPAAPLPVP